MHEAGKADGVAETQAFPLVLERRTVGPLSPKLHLPTPSKRTSDDLPPRGQYRSLPLPGDEAARHDHGLATPCRGCWRRDARAHGHEAPTRARRETPRKLGDH